MQKNLNRQYFFIVSLLSLAIGMTIHFPMIMDYFFGETDNQSRGFMISFTHLGLELLITCIVAFIPFTLNFFILKPVSRHDERKLLNIALAVALTILSVFILNHLLYNIKGIIDPQPQHSMGHRNNEGKCHFMEFTLDELSDHLDPAQFFRANRQYIISRKAVRDIDLWFNSRLSVNLKISVPEKIIVSKARITEFKRWFEAK